ncbi:MAG: histidine kinase [Cyclobacteriaceae bacterium]
MNFIDTLIYSEAKGIRILRHTLFWTTDMVSYLVVISANTEITPVIVFGLLSRFPLVMGVVYFILYYLIPKYSIEKNRVPLALWILGMLAFVGIGIRFYRYYLINPILDPQSIVPPDIFSFSRILGEIFSWMAVTGMAIAIKLIKTKSELQRKNDALMDEKRIAELNFLKAQMHPHFLFNTLNTLYSDAIKTNSKSEQIVLRLSSLMRFILDECSKPLIPLEKELKVIDDYLELEKLRHGNRLQIDWENSIRTPHVLISPLLLLPFVENSCKHTLSLQRGVIQIKIRVSSNENFITLYVENELIPTKQSALNGVGHGMGMKNVRKQLELLFRQNYTLDIKADSKYIVNLVVPTSKSHE